MSNKSLFDTFAEFIKINNIKQILISTGLGDYATNLSQFINMKEYEYTSDKRKTLFIGMYRDHEYNICMNHIGKKWIYWYKNDCSPLYQSRIKKVTSIALTTVETNLYEDDETKNNLNHFNLNICNIYDSVENDKTDANSDSEEDNCPDKILVGMPTYNRSGNIEDRIEMIQNQTYTNWTFLIIDDGSLPEHKKYFAKIKEKYKGDDRLVFMENKNNLHISSTLNRCIDYLLNADDHTHFTWISDDNDYYPNFLQILHDENNYFSYSAYDLKMMDNTVNTQNRSHNDFNDLLYDFKGCASFMWKRSAIKDIGYYNKNLIGCEDYEYLLRTFKSNHNKCIYVGVPTMLYVKHSESLYIKEKATIRKITEDMTQIYKYFSNENDSFVYYSKTSYNTLFQRPHQIMRFYSQKCNKCFIGTVNSVIYEPEYNLLIVPYDLRECVYSAMNSSNTSVSVLTYFTDTRLCEEIMQRQGKKLYDLIDAPIDEFSVWKPNLSKCVRDSDYVMYSHPDLVKFLNDINSNKPYHYISNACDYEYFSKSQNRIGCRPFDFPNTDKKILGYYGAFAKWLDYDLIKSYANESEYHIVMIGGIPANEKYNMKFSHDNITWLNHMPYDKLVYYLSWFDVCFLPFKKCELVQYVNPCKLWEYIASGKEIIKYNVNMECDTIVKYTDVCKKIEQIPTKSKNILQFYNITQLLTADCLDHLDMRFKKMYNLDEYSDTNAKTVYFGVYSVNDIAKIKKLNGTHYIIFGGTDVDLILGNAKLKKLFDTIDDMVIFHISNNIRDRLIMYGYKSIEFNLDLTDRDLFKKPDSLGDCVFVYNGRTKGSQEEFYGKSIYEQVVKNNPQYEYIYSSDLNMEYNEMPNIYKKCFIGLRLTECDGNANMVQEMECMGIPVIHNHSSYGLKWNVVNDINKILARYKK